MYAFIALLLFVGTHAPHASSQARPVEASASLAHSATANDDTLPKPRYVPSVATRSHVRHALPHVTCWNGKVVTDHPRVQDCPTRPAPKPVSHPRASGPVTSTGFTTTQLRIRSCESGPRGYATHGWAMDYDYRNQNPSSTASGAWQFLDSTWAGYGGYSRAMYAPPAVQDAKARLVFRQDGTTPWNASRSCWGS